MPLEIMFTTKPEVSDAFMFFRKHFHVKKPLLLILFLFSPTLGYAGTEELLCDTGIRPVYPPIGPPPLIETWTKDRLKGSSKGLDCTDLNLQRFTLLLALTGSFRSKESGDALLVRFGSISTLQGIRYWSVTDNRWETMITDATALEGPDINRQRTDFTLPEMKGGKDLYFSESDNRASDKVVCRMRIPETSGNRLEVNTSNITGINLFHLPVFDPGDLQSLFFVERINPDTWGYYSLSGIREKGIVSIEDHQKSYINRANAMYRHFTGAMPDRDPPITH